MSDKVQSINNQEETINRFLYYLDKLSKKEYDSNSLSGHSRAYLKSI